MSIFQRAMDRLADFIWIGRKVNLRFTAEYRTACYAVPLIDKLLSEGEDGDTYRTALVGWHTAERPPLATYQGSISRCRIDGPSQVAGQHWIPLGGLILSPGVTAHLEPFEAQALREQMEQAIEGVIRSWVREHSLQSLLPVDEHYNRSKADSKAKAIIVDWVTRQNREGASDPDPDPDPDADDADEAAPRSARSAGKGLAMTDRATQKAMLRGCDATHRASNSDTHLTHGCMAQFCGFGGMLIASRQRPNRANGAIQPFPAMANSISWGATR